MEDMKKIDTASAIKAITQMGHTCEVVLTRLTRMEIEKYTKRKERAPDKQVNNIDSPARKDLQEKLMSLKKKRARVIYSSDDETTSNSSDTESVKQEKKKKNHIKHHSPKKTLNENSVLSNTTNCSEIEKSTFTNNINKSHSTKNCSEIEKSTLTNNINKSPSIQVHNLKEGVKCPIKVHRSDSSSKKKRKMELLFGDDYDEIDEIPTRKSEYESKKHLGLTHLSATINVNFYYKDRVSDKNDSNMRKSVNSIHHKTNEKQWKENSNRHVHKVHKSKHRSKIEYDKKSKIYDNRIKKTEIKCIESSKLYTEVIKNNAIVEHLPKNKSDKIKLKSGESLPKSQSSPKRNDSENLDNTALLQGIWSSLGMQSPADRSDKIISTTLSETCTLYKAVISKNDVLLASGVGSELHKNNTVKYIEDNSSKNNGRNQVSVIEASCLSTDKENGMKKCLINTDSVNLNKDKETDNKSPTLQNGFTSDRGDLFERNIEVSEKQECCINGSNKNVDSCNPVKMPKHALKSDYETEVSQRIKKISSSETCSTSAVKPADDKHCIENDHIISTDSENCINNPISCSIDLSDSTDETSTPETLNSGIPASVGSASGTESCNISVLGTVDEIEDVGSCSSVEIVEADADNLVTCHSTSASENNNNLSNTGTSNNENLMSSTDINILTCESNIASEKKNNPGDTVLNEKENLQNTVSDTSKDSVGLSNSESSAVVSGTVTNNNNIGKIRVKDPKSLGIQSFGINSSGQCATVVSEQRRQSVENKRNSVEENIRKSGEENREKSVEETRRKSGEENREKSVEENRRKSVEEQRRLSIEEHRRQLVEEQRRLSIEEHRRQLVEHMTVEELIASSSNGLNLGENDVPIFRNYKKYFNELVESKLPKMGELLDLAVADSVRKDMRIHHSEKLSSPDLVKQEKLKAEKEFSDSLKTRGIEFTALLDSIIKKFDAQCTEDMVFALYSRILDIFKLIDKQNKKHITRTKVIIQKMLQKNGYKNESVYKILSKKTGDFSQSLSRISHCILMYNNMVKAVIGNNMSGTQSVSQSTVDTIRSVQANAGIEGTVTGPATVENFSHSGKGASGPLINECGTSEILAHAPLKTQNSVQTNTSGSIQTNTTGSTVDQRSSVNSFSWDTFLSGMLENSVDNNRRQVTSNTATVPNQYITEYSYNRNPPSVMNRPGENQYANQLPPYNSQPLSLVDKGGTAVNQNLSNLYYGSKSVTNPGSINHVNNIDANSSLMHLQKLNGQTASRTIHTNDVIRRNIVIDQQINNSVNQRINQIMRKRAVQLNSNSSSMNSTATARNQSAVMQINGNNISPNTINEANRSSQQCQNLSLSRQESNNSRMNINYSNMPTMIISGGTDTSDRVSQQANFSLMRNQNNMQPAVNMHSKLINQNQAPVGIRTNTMYVNNVQQIENAGRVPVNWRARDFAINSGVVTTMPGQSTAPNHSYSQIQITSNANYSNQNKDYVNRSNVSSVETASMQSNKLPQQQPNANIQNKNIGTQAGRVIQNSSTSNQKTAGNRPPPPLYSDDLFLKHLLETDNYSMFPESETLKKVIEDRVYLQKQSVEAGNQNIASREVRKNVNAATWNVPINVSLRPVVTGESIPVQPNGNSLHNIGGSSTSSNINVAPSTVNTQTLTAVNTNPNEISYQRIRLVGGVHNMKSHRNVAIAPRPGTNNSIQSIPTSKTQDRLPVISEVFTCENFMLLGQKDTTSVTNSAAYNAPVNTSCPSTSQSISTTMLSQLNSNSAVLRQSTEVPVPVSAVVKTISPQNYQLVAPNNNTSPVMASAVSASTNAVTSNFQLVYSNNDQSAPQSNGYNFNVTSVVSNANTVSAHASGQSVPSLPCGNSNDIVTLGAQSGKSASVANDGNSFNLPSVIIHHLPSSNIGEVSITSDHIETELALESGSLTCARGGCNQKSNKLCSVCKCTTYCSYECQTEDWYNGHSEKCRAP